MKRLLVTGVLALAAATLSQQQASAWCNMNFGVGLNLSWQCGGNSWLWGLYRCGQPGGAEPTGPGLCRNCPQGNCGMGYGYAMPPRGYGYEYMTPAPAAGPAMAPPAPAPVRPQAPAPAPTPTTWNYYPVYPNYYGGSYYVPVNWYSR